MNFVSTKCFSHSSQPEGFTILSTSENELIEEEYTWQKESEYFKKTNHAQSDFKPKKLSISNLKIKEDFLNELMEDSTGLKKHVLDSFTFPYLSYVDPNNFKNVINISDYDQFKTITNQHEYIFIKGMDNSGKSTFAKFLYNELVKDNIVLYIEEDNFKGINNADKLLKNSFIKQYDVESYDQFLKYDKSKKILIIDNGDKRINWINDLNPHFGKIIIIMNNNIKKLPFDIVDQEIERFDNSIELRIEGFLKSKRNELAVSFYNRLNSNADIKPNNNEITRFKNKFNSIVDTHLNLFGANPYMILLLVRHLHEHIYSNEKNIYNEVFRSNLNNLIKKHSEKLEIKSSNSIFTAVQKIAYYMHEKTINDIKLSQMSAIIERFNSEFRQTVNVADFIVILTRSKILKEIKHNEYTFSSQSVRAFFIASEIAYGINNHIKEHTKTYEHLFDALDQDINEKILLFLTFAQQSEIIVNKILDKATKTFADLEQFSYKEFKHLKSEMLDLKWDSAITEQQRKENVKHKEKVEKKILIEMEANNYTPYGKNKDKIETEFYKKLGYIRLLSTILPNFTHIIKSPIQYKIAEQLYILPNKVLKFAFSDLLKHKDQLIKKIIDFASKDKNINQNDRNALITRIEALMEQILILVVSMYYSEIGELAMDYTTEELFIEKEFYKNSQFRHQYLMFGAFAKTTKSRDDFKKKMIDQYKQYEANNNKLFTQYLYLVTRTYQLVSEDQFENKSPDIEFIRIFYNMSIFEFHKFLKDYID